MELVFISVNVYNQIRIFMNFQNLMSETSNTIFELFITPFNRIALMR